MIVVVINWEKVEEEMVIGGSLFHPCVSMQKVMMMIEEMIGRWKKVTNSVDKDRSEEIRVLFVAMVN